MCFDMYVLFSFYVNGIMWIVTSAGVGTSPGAGGTGSNPHLAAAAARVGVSGTCRGARSVLRREKKKELSKLCCTCAVLRVVVNR